VLGSYRFDTSSSTRANRGYILYTFSPHVSPGSLIITISTNPTYLETVNSSISRMNFRLVDKDFNLIDLSGEQIRITLVNYSGFLS
jgi:hypothetical protein